MKKLLLLTLVSMVLFSSAAFADRISLIGGIRGGLAVGIAADHYAGENLNLRYGVEVNSGLNGLILFGEDKFLLSSGKTPVYLGLGIVGYFGSGSSAGISLSVIFDHAFDVQRLFVELGADFVSEARLQLQAGFRLD